MKKATFLLMIMMILLAAFISACKSNDDAGQDVDVLPTEQETFVRTSDEPDVLPEQNQGVASMVAPQIQGDVLEVRNDDALAILVDSHGEVKGEVWVSITDETYFFEDVDPNSSIGISNVSREFNVGNRVAIYVTEVAESYPMQAVAQAVYENSAQ